MVKAARISKHKINNHGSRRFLIGFQSVPDKHWGLMYHRRIISTANVNPLFALPANTEQIYNYYSFGDVFEHVTNMFSIFYCELHQLSMSGSSAAKCSIIFTSWLLNWSVLCWAVSIQWDYHSFLTGNRNLLWSQLITQQHYVTPPLASQLTR